MKLVIFVFLTIFAFPAHSQTIEEGIRKFEAQEYDISYQIFSKFEGANNVKATEYLSYHYWYGLGVEKDRVKGCDYFEDVAGTGNAEAISHLGKCYLDNGGRTVDYKKGYELLLKASEMGFLGDLDVKASAAFITGDYPRALGYYVGAADKGDYHAMIMLGVMYRDGLAVTKNHEKACGLFEKALPSKMTTALHNFGDCLYFGLDRPVDKKGAYPYFKEAADLGSGKSKLAAEAIHKELYGDKSE